MNNIEETRREMYRLLAHLKSNRTGHVLMQSFEDKLEDHLECLRNEQRRLRYLADDYRQGASVEAKAADEARAEVRDLAKKLGKKTGRISQLKAWMRAAVRDNQRLRKDRKAFIETQEEHLAEIKRLSAYLHRQEGMPGFDGDEISGDPIPVPQYEKILPSRTPGAPSFGVDVSGVEPKHFMRCHCGAVTDMWRHALVVECKSCGASSRTQQKILELP